jgi:mRNA interferase MazF
LTRDEAIPRLGRALVALCTTNVRGLRSEVLLDPDQDPVPQLTAINLDSIESVELDDLVQRMGRLDHSRMQAVCAALEVAVGCSR